MAFKDLPIRRKLMIMLVLTSGVTVVLTCLAFIGYEYVSFRVSATRDLAALGRVLATNSTAALASDSPDDAQKVLATLASEPQVIAAALYNAHGALVALYPAKGSLAVPSTPEEEGYRFEEGDLLGFQAILGGSSSRLGTLFLKSDLGAERAHLILCCLIAAAMTALALALAYMLSRFLQPQISDPVQMLVSTALAVSQNQDYSVRATKLAQDELGHLTDAFNQMLNHIQLQDRGVRQSESRLRAVIDSSLSAVIVMDAHGRVQDWNPRAEVIFGWSRTEALGRDVAELIIPDHLRSAHRRGMQRFIATGEGHVLHRLNELQALRRDGTEFPVELLIRPIQIQNLLSFCGFVTDVTERQLARDKVRTQLARLDLLNRITHAIGERQDLDSIFQVVIRRLEDNLPIDFCCIAQYDSQEQMLTVCRVGAQSRSLALELALTEEARIPIDQNGLSRCVGGQLVCEADIQDSIFPFPSRLAAAGLRSLVVAPLPAESKVFGVLVAARRAPGSFGSDDCEFLRQLCEHVGLAAHQAQLYQALQRAYEDLRQSQQTLLQQERLRALGQMASGVAHDINNAISPVYLYTEMLLEREPLSDAARSHLTTIQRAVESVAQTVSRMRDFYRKREPEMVLARVHLNEIIQDVLELTRARWRDLPQERGIVFHVHTELTPALPRTLGAQNEIRDALTNLVFNALDAMPEGGELTLRTGVREVARPHDTTAETGAHAGGPRHEDSAVAVYVEVADTGVGMDEETRRHCLEPFFTTKGERGTGMGLAMVYGMIERHSGELEIDSAPGQGTTVRMIFPVATGVVDATGLQPILAPLAVSLRILVVDDDPLIIESLCETLRGDGHQVVAAEGGQAGIDMFLSARRMNEPFTLVITDLGMPYVDGRRVAAAIKAASPRTPVILLTGWGQRLSAEGEVPAHVDRVLNKPPRLRDLRLALSELVSGTHAA